MILAEYHLDGAANVNRWTVDTERMIRLPESKYGIRIGIYAISAEWQDSKVRY